MPIPSIRTEIKRFLIVSLWIVFSVGYFTRFPLPGFLSKIYLIALAGVVSASAWGWGTLIVNRTLIPALDQEEALLFGTAAGFGLISLLMVLAGVFGFWTRGGAFVLIAIGLLLGWRNYKKRHSPRPLAGNLRINDGSPTTTSGMTSFIPFFLITIGTILSLLIAFAPVTYYDSLVYHLALPQAYIQAGHWIGQKELIYSAFPQNLEMIWTLGILLAGDVFANLLGWVIAIQGIVAVYLFGRRFFEPKTAIWAAAFLSIMPAYLLLSSGGYIDLGLTLFSFLSFYVLCLWTRSLAPLALAGFFAGCAVGTKYTGAIPFGIGILIILKGIRPLKLNTVALRLTLYAGTALLVLSPWLIKNFHYFGNPVFPFFYRWSFKSMNPWTSDAAAGYFRGLTEYTPRSGWHLLQLVWDICVNGLNLGGGMDVLGDLGWAPLFAFIPAVWLVRKKSPVLFLISLFVVGYFIPWGMSRPVLRFMMPLAPFLALLAAYGYEQGIGSETKPIRLIAHFFLTFLIVSGFHNFFDVVDTLSLYKVPLGFASRADYLSHELNYFDAASFTDALPENSLTYVVGDQRGYYYNKPVLVTPVFNTNPLTEWANQSSSAEDLASRLKARNITHLLVNNTEFKRLDSVYHLFPFTSLGQANWDGLRAHVAKRLYHDPNCDVFAL